jgi:uncharacterized protein YndB with AHSA1/START domain
MPKFEREIEIDAPVQKVWDALIDTNRWPEWFPGIDTVSGVSSLQEGARFQWTDEGKSGSGTIVKMQAPERLEVMTQMGDDKDSHVFNLKPSGGFLGMAADECKVEYILDTLMGGGILSNFIAGGNPRDMLRVKKAVTLFRKLVENK